MSRRSIPLHRVAQTAAESGSLLLTIWVVGQFETDPLPLFAIAWASGERHKAEDFGDHAERASEARIGKAGAPDNRRGRRTIAIGLRQPFG